MPFEAKALAPSGSDPEAIHGAFADAATGGVSVLEAPSGHVLTEGLASALTGAGRAPLWLRLEPEDRDPATFLVSLAAAAQRAGGGMGQATLKLMRAYPADKPDFQPHPRSSTAKKLIHTFGVEQGVVAAAINGTLNMT